MLPLIGTETDGSLEIFNKVPRATMVYSAPAGRFGRFELAAHPAYEHVLDPGTSTP